MSDVSEVQIDSLATALDQDLSLFNFEMRGVKVSLLSAIPTHTTAAIPPSYPCLCCVRPIFQSNSAYVKVSKDLHERREDKTRERYKYTTNIIYLLF